MEGGSGNGQHPGVEGGSGSGQHPGVEGGSGSGQLYSSPRSGAADVFLPKGTRKSR